MSIAVSTLVWANGPSKAADRLMLLAIADNADDYGLAWPGMERLATKCCVQQDAARATVKRLEADGWLEVSRGGGIRNGHGIPNRYQLNMERLRGTPPSTGGYTPPSTPTYPPVDTAPTPSPTGGEPSENHHGNRQPGDEPLFSPSLAVVQPDAVPVARPKPAPTRAHQLPETFRPSDAHVALAAEVHVNLRAEWPQFVDHHRAKGSTMKDWDAALRTWIRNAARFQAQRGGPPPSDDPAVRPVPKRDLYG